MRKKRPKKNTKNRKSALKFFFKKIEIKINYFNADFWIFIYFLTIIKNKPDKLSGLLNNISSKTSILLVDPLGNVILRYDNQFEGKKLLKDIKKLFKLSRIG